MTTVDTQNERRAIIERLDNRIRRLKNSYQGQNDWCKIKAEIQKRGGRWVAENGMTYILKDGVIYVHTKESGIGQVMVWAYDAPIPYIAELTIDMQHVRPENRRKFLEELNKEVKKKAGATSPTEVVVIIKDDWLSKISLKRWGNDKWQNYLVPTQSTLDSPKRRGRGWNPDLIYPGDTFIVK